MDLASRLTNFFTGRQAQPKVNVATQPAFTPQGQQVQPVGFGQDLLNKAAYGVTHLPFFQSLVGLQKATPAFQQSGQQAFQPANFINNNRSITDYIPRFQAPVNSGIPGQIFSTVANMPMDIGSSIVGKGIIDPALDLGRLAGGALTHQQATGYNTLKSPLARLGYNAGGINATPQQILGNLGGVAEPILNAVGGEGAMGMAEQVAKAAPKRTLMALLKHEVPQGLKLGAGFGLASGLNEGRNKSLQDQLTGAAISTGTNAIGGGLLAGGLTAGSYASGKLFNIMKNVALAHGLSDKAANEAAMKNVKNIPRDLLGKFAKSSSIESPTPPGLLNNMSPQQHIAPDILSDPSLPGVSQMFGNKRGLPVKMSPEKEAAMFAEMNKAAGIPEKIDIPGPGLSIKEVNSKNIKPSSFVPNPKIAENLPASQSDIIPQARPGDFSNSRSADQLFAKKNLEKVPAGNPEPLPWEPNGDAHVSTTPKNQQPPSPVQLGSETKSIQPQTSSIDSHKPLPSNQVSSSSDIINQNLKGSNYKYDEGLGAGKPRYPGEKTPLIGTPQGTLKDALSSRYVAGEQISQRAAVLKGLQDQGIKSPVEHNLYRDVIEHPEDMSKVLTQVKNPQAFEKAVQAHREFTDYIHSQNLESGGNVGYKKNYATHIWDLTDPAKAAEYQTMLNGKAKNFKGYFNKERVFNDIREGNAAGFQLKNKTAQEDITQLASTAQKEIQGRVFANKLKSTFPGEVHIMKNDGEPPANAIQLTIPGMKGTYVSPNLYEKIKFLQPQDFGKVAKVMDFVSGGIKHLELSGGLFHVKNTGMDYLGSHLAYGKMPRVDQAAHVFFSSKAMNEYRQGLIESGQMDKMLKAGVTLSKAQDFPSAEGITGLRSTISKVNPLSMLNRATFTRLEDYFKSSVFNIMDKKGMIDFSTPEKAKASEAIGAQLNNIFGSQNRSIGDSVLKSKFGQWIGRQGVLAPDYQEGRFKRTLSAINPNFTGKQLGKLPARTAGNDFALRTLAGRLIVTAALAEISRRVISGQFNPDLKSILQNDIIDPSYPTPFTNKNSKGQDVTQVAHMPSSNVSDILKLGQDPEHFAISHLGAGVSAGIGYVANQDYFGNKLSNTNNSGEKIGNIIKSKLPIPIVQAQKVLSGKISPGNAAINIAGDRVTQNPADPIVQANKLASNAYDAAYKSALASGKSDLSAQMSGLSAFKKTKQTGQSPYDATGQNKGVANGTTLLTKDNKVIDLKPKTKGQGIDAFTNQNDTYSKAREVWKANLDQSQKDAAFKQLGVTNDQVRYDYIANHSNDVKTQYILSKNMNHQDLLDRLTTGRQKSVSGSIFASDGVINSLKDQGLLSNSEATALKNKDFNKDGSPVTKKGTGKKASLKVDFRTFAKKLTEKPIHMSTSRVTKVKSYTPKKVHQPKVSEFKLRGKVLSLKNKARKPQTFL